MSYNNNSVILFCCFDFENRIKGGKRRDGFHLSLLSQRSSSIE